MRVRVPLHLAQEAFGTPKLKALRFWCFWRTEMHHLRRFSKRDRVVVSAYARACSVDIRTARAHLGLAVSAGFIYVDRGEYVLRGMQRLISMESTSKRALAGDAPRYKRALDLGELQQFKWSTFQDSVFLGCWHFASSLSDHESRRQKPDMCPVNTPRDLSSVIAIDNRSGQASLSVISSFLGISLSRASQLFTRAAGHGMCRRTRRFVLLAPELRDALVCCAQSGCEESLRLVGRVRKTNPTTAMPMGTKTTYGHQLELKASTELLISPSYRYVRVLGR